jgi:hypothetical protein
MVTHERNNTRTVATVIRKLHGDYTEMIDICIFICSYIRSFLPQVLYTVWYLSKSYAHINCKKQQLVGKTRKEKRKKTSTDRLMLGLADLMQDCWSGVRLHPEGPASSQLTQGVPMVFLGPRTNAELVPKFHIALHASHAALLMITLTISLYTNVTLTLGWPTLSMGDMGEGALHENERSNCQTKKIKIWSWAIQGARHLDEQGSPHHWQLSKVHTSPKIK